MNTVPELLISGLTDVGRMRDHNEDNIAWDTELGLALLADGMGGHNAGEVASAIAVDIIRNTIAESLRSLAGDEGGDDPNQSKEAAYGFSAVVHEAISAANRAILSHAEGQPQCAGMGTTVVMVLFQGPTLTLAHVGDSRIYRLRGPDFRQMTTDHSLVQELVENGFLTHEEARASANKNLITRALGIDSAVQADVLSETYEPGDLFLLCSDGLSDLVADEEIHTLLNVHAGEDQLDDAASALVDMANERGGMDNISVILIRVK